MNAIEAWVSAHPWLAVLLAAGAPATIAGAVATAVRAGGKAETWWGAALLSLCSDVAGATRAVMDRGAEKRGQP